MALVPPGLCGKVGGGGLPGGNGGTLPTIAEISARRGTAPHLHSHDSLLQTEETILFLVAGLLFYPTLFSMFGGQINVILLVLLVALYRYALRSDSYKAGAVAGMATLLKFFRLLWVLPLLSRDRWRVSAALGTTIFLGGMSALPLIGLGAYVDYFSDILPGQTYYAHPLNQSLVGFLSRLPLGGSTIWQWLSLVFSGLIVSATLYLLVRRASEHTSISLRISLAVVTALLIFPITWVATLVLLLFPLAVLWRHGAAEKSAASLLVATSCYLLVTLQRGLEWALASETWSPATWLLSLPFYGVLILWTGLAVQLLAARQAQSV